MSALPLVMRAQPVQLPNLRVLDDAGRPVDLSSFQGKMILLNIWATWCPPCRQEMPSLDRLQAQLGETIMRDLRRDPDVSDDVEVSEYLNRLGTLLGGTPGANGFTLEFFLVLASTLNAFALPGGFSSQA